jgi:hypothetical protein
MTTKVQGLRIPPGSKLEPSGKILKFSVAGRKTKRPTKRPSFSYKVG